VAVGDYKITKEVGSFDGHLINRFRSKTGCEKGEGTPFYKNIQ
jgi:hypothetical protein